MKKTHHILVVDDVASNIQIMVQQLIDSKEPYKVMGANNGQRALSIAQSEKPDLIITDWEMPGMSGLELTQAIKNHPETQFIPVLMVSGMRTSAEDLQAALESGAIDFLRKPVNKVELWARVSNTLQLAETHKLQRQANEKLKALDELKSHFFTNISHEFRTPLTVISGLTDLILESPGKWPEKEIKIIQRNSRILLDLVSQILDLRKLEAGKLKLELVQANIIPYLRYLVESFHSLANSKDIQLHFHTEENNLMMDYDSEKILRILSNLLSNAIKYTPEGGQVFVKISTSESAGNDHLMIQVKDTGIGITKDQQSHIFNRFYQATNGQVKWEGSTGIGLALVHELTKLMNGSVSVSSQPGKGSTFSVSLPITQKAKILEKDRPIDSVSALDLINSEVLNEPVRSENSNYLPSLLIVEDNHDITQYLVACLQDQFHLDFARDGQEGIEKAFQNSPDIILSDVMMPHKDGFELCETLKLDERTSHIPIVLLTAKADMASRIEGLEKGADAYLAKPFNKKELFVCLKKLIELRRRLQERYKSLETPAVSKDSTFKLEDAFMLKIQEAVELYLDDKNFGAVELARVIGMSRSSLYAKVKALTQRSPALLIRSFRLKKSKEILENSDLNISQVAYEVGFHDPSYFSRCFSEEFGIPPTQFRN